MTRTFIMALDDTSIEVIRINDERVTTFISTNGNISHRKSCSRKMFANSIEDIIKSGFVEIFNLSKISRRS